MLLCLVLQVSVVALVPLADSSLESGEDRRPHIEALGAESCPVEHDHLACQLCRTIRCGSGPLPDARPSLAFATPRASVVRATPPALLSARFAGPFGARAPPEL